MQRIFKKTLKLNACAIVEGKSSEPYITKVLRKVSADILKSTRC